MAEERPPVVYGLWNEVLEEWFNPGTRRPYFPSRAAAMRLLPLAQRQYSLGKWEVREYPLDVSPLEGDVQPVAPPAQSGAA
jgi:hypothetical protein